MRALAVVYCFPPLLVPAALCYLKLILGLQEEGVEVETLEISPGSFLAPGSDLTDPALNDLVPDNLVRHHIWSLETQPLLKLLKRTVGTLPPFYRLFEPKKKEWIHPARRYLGKLDLDRYDVILTCSQPHVNHLLGLELKKSTGLPWVAYFSDPWSRNPYASFPSPRIARYHRTLEQKVLTGADQVLFTSPEMLRLAEQDYVDLLREKGGVLSHSFVPGWYGDRGERDPRGPLRLLHTGHFYGPRSPDPLLRALGHLNRAGGLSGKLQIDSHGTFQQRSLDLIQQEDLQDVVRVRPVIPYLESLSLMGQYDGLLLVDAPLTGTEESVFLPSKLVDYMGSGTPVIALTPTPGTSERVVSAIGGLVCDIGDETAIEAIFRGLLDGSPLPAPVAEEVEHYHYRRVARGFISDTEKLLDPQAFTN